MTNAAFKAAALFYLVISASGCTPIEGTSLVTDQKEESSIHDVDQTPKIEELYLKTFTPGINTLNTVTRAEVSGECYVSTYPNHQILAFQGSTQLELVDIEPSTPLQNYARCVNGRFNLALRTSNMAAGTHSIRLVLRAFDSSNKMYVNEGQGTTTINLSR